MTKLSRQLGGGRAVLFHGTRYPKSILECGRLLFATAGDPVVSFTRSPEVAAYWATLKRPNDEGRGAVLAFDRDSLATRYRLEPFHDEIWDTATCRNDEMEERVYRANVDFVPHLLGVISTLDQETTAETRARAFLHRLRMQDHPARDLARMSACDFDRWSEQNREKIRLKFQGDDAFQQLADDVAAGMRREVYTQS